jgi:hypothetical protein
MLIWSSESRLSGLFSEVSLVRDHLLKFDLFVFHNTDVLYLPSPLVLAFSDMIKPTVERQRGNPKIVVYYESRKWELKKRHKNEDRFDERLKTWLLWIKKARTKERRKNEYRCDERLKTKSEESTWLSHTGFHEELEHLKIKTKTEESIKKNSFHWVAR